jgi:uncharacterized protein YbjT (DUF2867 family)
MKIVISGATGNIGQQLISLLDFSAHDYVLITRDKSKLASRRLAEGQIAEGSLFDVEFLTKTLADADVYFFLPPPNFQSDDMVAEYRRLAEVSSRAASSAGVKRIVHLSTLGAHLNTKETGLALGQSLAEGIIRGGARNVLHLRCGFFLENYFGSLQTIKEQGSVYLPVKGSSTYEFVTTADIAANVNELLHSTAWAGHGVVELHGVETSSFDAVAALIAEGLNRPVQHVGVPQEAAVQALAGMGMSLSYARDLAQLIVAIDIGLLKPEFKRGEANVRTGQTTPSAFARKVLAHAI